MKEKISYKIKNMLKTTILMIVLSGCSALGTKTISKSENLKSFDLRRLGYSQVASEIILNKMRPKTSTIFESAMEDYFFDKAVNIQKYELMKFEYIEDIDSSEVIQICNINNLDGYLCTQVVYKSIDNYDTILPLATSEDAYVEIKLFDNQGKLLIHTKHNTFAGNSYLGIPRAEKTVRNGTIGALKRIMKEIKTSN